MNEQTEYDPSSPDYQSGYRVGYMTGTLHKALEVLRWDPRSTDWGSPTGDWQWGFVDGYEARSGKHIAERV